MSMVHANSYENDCADRFLSSLSEPGSANMAGKYFEIPDASTAEITSIGRALNRAVSKLGGISQVKALPSMPVGRTAKIQIFSSEKEVKPFIGKAFEAISGNDGRVILFVSQRKDYACSIFSFAVLLPDSLPRYQEIATEITQAIGQISARPESHKVTETK